MVRYISLLLFIGLAWGQVDTLWTKTFGGSNEDGGYSVQQTDDGGYIITGYTRSFLVGGVDIWLIKTDSQGQEEWNQTFGGDLGEYGYSVQQTTDGGYIITGSTLSYGNGGANVWLIKTDSNGDSLWTKTFGGDLVDVGYSVQQTENGGYIVTGRTESFGNGGRDVWLIKTDSQGQEEWNQTFGGSASDIGHSVQQTEDGGYIIAGETQSFGNGGKDVWLIKTDSQGQEEWNQTFGGSASDIGHSVQQTTDGGYIIIGTWLIKTDSNGNEEWINDDISGRSGQQTVDGLYIIAGSTYSYVYGGMEVWLIKTDCNGDSLWANAFGGYGYDEGHSVQQTTDGGYIVTGLTQSYGNGDTDVWLIKTTHMNSSPPQIDNIEDHQILEDSSLTVEVSATSPYCGMLMTFSGTSDTSDVVVSLDSTSLTATPSPDWFGTSEITVMVTDENDLSDTTDFTLTVTPVNDSLEPFSVIYPAVSDTFSTHVDSDTAIAFTWEESYDVDSDVTYTLTIELEFFGNTYTDVHENISDTTISISSNSLDPLLNVTSQDEAVFTYYVYASDEEYTVASDVGEFVLFRAALGVNEGLSVPDVYALHQNYPNPFNPVTTLRYDLPEDALVNITVYDMMGRQISTLVNTEQTAGYKSVQWNATNNEGQLVSAGVYLYTIEAGDFRQTKKMVLLK